jgi:hypothetical protein
MHAETPHHDRVPGYMDDRLEHLADEGVEVASGTAEQAVPATGVAPQGSPGVAAVAGGDTGTAVVERVRQVDLRPEPTQPVPFQFE